MRAPNMNLPPESMAWGRWAQETLEDLARQNESLRQDTGNSDRTQGGTLDSLGQNIINLDNRVQEALGNVTVRADQVVSGTLDDARIPNLNQNKVFGVWDKGVSTGAAISGGSVTSPTVYGTAVTGADVFAQSVSNLITATRVAVWGRTSDGYIATASSSERYKTNIRPTDIDPLAVLSIEPVYYQWIELLQEKERRANLPAGHIDWNPDMHVGVEVGMIAERLHEAGLWQFVVYKRDEFDRPILKDGDVIPEGIHYINWGIALQVVARHLHTLVTDQGKQIDALTKRLDDAGL